MKKQNLILMYGEDTFSLQNEVKRWRRAFIEKHGGDMNLEVFDGENLDMSSFSTSITSLPFLAEKRLIILKNFLSSNNAESQKVLLEILEKLADTSVLLIVETNSPDKRTALFKQLTKVANIKLFTKPKGAQLSSWIVNRAKKHEGQIDFNSANYLASLIGDDLFGLENEIAKLCLYSEGNPITIGMIDELVSSSIEKSIFTMTDQLAKKDHKAALKTMGELQEQGHEAPYLFAMIARQFRLMLEMKALSENRTPPNAIASKMKVHPFVVKNTLSQCRNFTYGQLKTGLQKLLEIDRRLKSGRLHLRPNEPQQYLLALERVIIEN